MLKRAEQQGLVVIAFVAVLAFAMGLALLWSGGALVFTQRAASNQTQQASAFAAAESGLAWAEARLNDARAVDAACRPVASGASFRDRYAAPWVAVTDPSRRHGASAGFEPPMGWRALCRIEADGIDCRCPDTPLGARDAAIGDTGVGSRFSIELEKVDGEPRSLWVVARGCSGAWAGCLDPGAATSSAQAVVRAQLRLVDPEIATDPAKALRSGPIATVPRQLARRSLPRRIAARSLPVRTMTTQRVRAGGFALIEVLIAALIFGLAALALTRLQTLLIRHAADAQQRSEATVLAQSRLDELRAALIGLPAGAPWPAEVGTADGDAAVGHDAPQGSAASFDRHWRVHPVANDPALRRIDVRVGWTDRDGHAEPGVALSLLLPTHDADALRRAMRPGPAVH